MIFFGHFWLSVVAVPLISCFVTCSIEFKNKFINAGPVFLSDTGHNVCVFYIYIFDMDLGVRQWVTKQKKGIKLWCSVNVKSIPKPNWCSKFGPDKEKNVLLLVVVVVVWLNQSSLIRFLYIFAQNLTMKKNAEKNKSHKFTVNRNTNGSCP